MNTALALLAGATAFFAGFCLGTRPPRYSALHNVQTNRGRAESTDNIISEYRNFLNYDGTEQQ